MLLKRKKYHYYTSAEVEWLRANAGNDVEALYWQFLREFSLDPAEVGRNSYDNARQRYGVKCPNHKYEDNLGGKRRHRALLTERTRDGYVEVKVAEPRTWRPKARVMWEQYHGRPLEDTEVVVHLDGNSQNFERENLEIMTRKTVIYFQLCGGVVPGAPELSLVNLANARLMEARNDLGRKLGLLRDDTAEGKRNAKRKKRNGRKR